MVVAISRIQVKMQLKELSWIVPTIEPGTILKALETAIPASAIEQALKDTKAIEERKRALPSHLVVCLIIAMSLWSKTSMRGVLKNLVDGCLGKVLAKLWYE
jgi:Insertion element 4 transposase N-terminal